ncbi:nuclear transport factor 2 family protein [Flavobacterium sp. NKUCC04_CG]|uniref:nuclear transport factor 2 family protein n=1 Tax=Flavobacterium sp. NKUCC04_CG TaxID=2842121 RepID=UPI001C5AF18D|nr:nuclear transport factor 2 family protein [Flavobacterium sp. NKUCC04_CG]MBW3520027.1 nuclear transport factor 2 family protein [Flavobacterium sp. NKUCC04_CG]
MEFTPKKEIAKQFLYLITQGEIDKAFANYIGPDFKHHNPFNKGGAADFKVFLKDEAQINPHKIIKNLRLIEQNDLVMVHSLVKKTIEDIGSVVVYIFRFENHLITEFWDVEQAIPQTMINENGML